MSQVAFSLLSAVILFWIAHEHIYPYFYGEKPEKFTSVTLQETIQELKLELSEIGKVEGETAGLEMTQATIELVTQKQDTTSASASLEVPVFEETALKSASAIKLTQGSKMTLVLTPASGSILLSDDSEVAKGRLDLAALVVAAREALLSTMAMPPTMAPKTVEIEVSFVFVKSDSAEAGIKAFVVEVGAENATEKTSGNKITLKFVNSKVLEAERRAALAKAMAGQSDQTDKSIVIAPK